MTTITTKRMPPAAPAVVKSGVVESVVVGGFVVGGCVVISPVKESKILVSAISMAKNRD